MRTAGKIVASAPGRLDVMGGIADYSGSLVLQLALPQQTTVALQLRTDYQCHLTSVLPSGEVLSTSLDYRDLLKSGEADYTFACGWFNKPGRARWAAYVMGCALVLQREQGILFTGADIEIRSQVPLGKGVSSSASIEVAVMKALSEAFDLHLEGTQLPVFAQLAENRVVGAPCGLMDQLASYFGNPGMLLPILCQPDNVQEPVRIPEGIFFTGIDSGVKHSVGSSAYADVRSAAFMGYTIIARHEGVSANDIDHARKTGDRSGVPFKGYLATIPVDDFESRYRKLLPDVMSGAVFLERYGGTIDPITVILPERHYRILDCTQHPVYESYRANRFKERLVLLNRGIDHQQQVKLLHEMGTCMYQSHESYTRCGLGDAKTDEIVRLVSGKPGIFGARITGGGQGGTVCVFGTAEGMDGVKGVCDELGVGLIGS